MKTLKKYRNQSFMGSFSFFKEQLEGNMFAGKHFNRLEEKQLLEGVLILFF